MADDEAEEGSDESSVLSEISEGFAAEIEAARRAKQKEKEKEEHENELARELGEDQESEDTDAFIAPAGYYQIDTMNDLVPVFACWQTKADDRSFAVNWVKQWKLSLPSRDFFQVHKGWTWAVLFAGPTHSFVCLPHAWITHERLVRLNKTTGLSFISTSYPMPGKLGVKVDCLIDMSPVGVDPVICGLRKDELARRGKKRTPDSLTCWLGDDPHDARSLPKYAVILAPNNDPDEQYVYVVKRVRNGADEELDYDPAVPEDTDESARALPSYGPNARTCFDDDTFGDEYVSIMSCSLAYRRAWLSQRLLLKQGDVYAVVTTPTGWFLAPHGSLTTFFAAGMTAYVPDRRTGRTRRVSIAKSIKEAIPKIWGITVSPSAPSLANGLLNVYSPFAYRAWDLSVPLNWKKLGPFLCNYTERFHRGNWAEAHMSLACFGYFLLHPNECVESMPIYKGTNGIGKTMLLNIFLKIVGNSSAKIYDKAAEVFDRFNFSDIAVLLHMIDENTFGRTDYNWLKSRITAKSFSIEPKGKEKFRVDVPRFYMLACNTVEDINIDLEERRVLAFEGMRADVKMLFVDDPNWRSCFHDHLEDHELLVSLASFLTKHLDLSVFLRQKGMMYPTAELHRMRVRALPSPQRTWVECCEMGSNHCGTYKKGEGAVSRCNWLTRINLAEFNQLVFGYSHASRSLAWIKEYGLALGNGCIIVPPLSEARAFVAAKIRGWKPNDEQVLQTVFMSVQAVRASGNPLLLKAVNTKILLKHPATFLHFFVSPCISTADERDGLFDYTSTLQIKHPSEDTDLLEKEYRLQQEPEEEVPPEPDEPPVRKRAREPPRPRLVRPAVSSSSSSSSGIRFAPVAPGALPEVGRIYHLNEPLPDLPDEWDGGSSHVSPIPPASPSSPDARLRLSCSAEDILPLEVTSVFTGIQRSSSPLLILPELLLETDDDVDG